MIKSNTKNTGFNPQRRNTKEFEEKVKRAREDEKRATVVIQDKKTGKTYAAKEGYADRLKKEGKVKILGELRRDVRL